MCIPLNTSYVLLLTNRQEAVQAAISEKDANIALLEMTSTKQRKNTEEIEKLNKEKEKLHTQLKEVVRFLGLPLVN